MAFDLLLSNISKRISLTEREIEFFSSLVKEKSLTSGAFLLREGEVCKFETFVVKGCLKSYYHDDHGAEHVLDFLVEEWWADDLFSFLTQTASKSSIKAIEDSEVLQISKNDLEILYQKIPAFERFFRLLFQSAYIAQKEQINLILSTPAEKRYKFFLKKKPYANKRFVQKDIASYLGITPQFFSTLKKKIGPVNVD